MEWTQTKDGDYTTPGFRIVRQRGESSFPYALFRDTTEVFTIHNTLCTGTLIECQRKATERRMLDIVNFGTD